MNRAQRRQQERYLRSQQALKDIEKDKKTLSSKIELYDKVTQRLDAMTQEDVAQEAYKKGYKDGVEESGKKIIERYYAATMLALHDTFGFGQERCLKALRRIDQCIIECLTDEELVEKAQKELEIEIVLDEAIQAQPM